VVAFSVIVQGLTMGPLLQILGLLPGTKKDTGLVGVKP
jgi:NhaP-type Na+/H+ or K+/H+ antiporter